MPGGEAQQKAFKELAWKKAAIGCSLVFFAAVSLIVYCCNKVDEGLCGNDIVQNVVSPDGTVKAVVFERDCGATTNFSTQVSVVGATQSLPNFSGNVFVRNGNAVATAPKNTIPLHVIWLDARHLQIRYPGQTRIYQKTSFTRVGLGWFRNALIYVCYSAAPSLRAN